VKTGGGHPEQGLAGVIAQNTIMTATDAQGNALVLREQEMTDCAVA